MHGLEGFIRDYVIGDECDRYNYESKDNPYN